ncbi:hypothetical protein DL768_010894 [Monosporascus sp. mg162]|nr:hypothetical protein DL768_010894 [Monosporascus sp. mg162]
MSTKEKPRLRKRLGEWFKGRRAATPAPSATQSMDVRSSDQGNAKHGSKTSSGFATESCAPPSLSPADSLATRSSTEAMATDPYQPAAASQAPPLALLVKPPHKPAATEYTEQPTTVLSASEKLWNAAYDSLETDNAKYVESYVEILEKVLGGETCEPTDDLSAKLKDPSSRQKHIRELVQKGQEKISKPSRITTKVGDIADFILSAKNMVDLVLQSAPQTKDFLGMLVKLAEGMKTQLGDIHQDIQEFIRLQKEMKMDDKDEKCLQDLFVVDPQDDMEKIQRNKDMLLDEGYNWILNTKEYVAFTDWSSGGSALPSCRLMWIKGHAGTGKTMLLMGIIRELSSQPATLAPKVSHFFCQGTDQALNNATATLRSLIWLLLVQQPNLISHLRSKHRNAGSSLFEGENAFIALSNAFKSMLRDPDLCPVYFIIDALDECEQGLAGLIELISTSLALSDKVKWLVSGRPTVELKTPDTAGSLVELDAQRLEGPVNAYIDHKLSILKIREGYDDRILAEIANEVRHRAANTFLWVALVFKELDAGVEDLNPVHGAYALEIIKEIPPGLSKLYHHMLTKIEKGTRSDPQYCKNALVAIVLTYRPLTLSELAVLAELPSNMHPRTVTKKCGSFLTIKQETVYLIHQSAKDYLDENYTCKLQPAGAAQGHTDIGRRSINAMTSVLKQNMYNLDFGFKPKDITPPDPDPLASIRYSCVFWADHLCFLDGKHPECLKELTDNGKMFKFLKDRFFR